MKINRDFSKQTDDLPSERIFDMTDDVEGPSLEEKISFLYEVTGGILMNAINLVEKDGHPSAESNE